MNKNLTEENNYNLKQNNIDKQNQRIDNKNEDDDVGILNDLNYNDNNNSNKFECSRPYEIQEINNDDIDLKRAMELFNRETDVETELNNKEIIVEYEPMEGDEKDYEDLFCTPKNIEQDEGCYATLFNIRPSRIPADNEEIASLFSRMDGKDYGETSLDALAMEIHKDYEKIRQPLLKHRYNTYPKWTPRLIKQYMVMKAPTNATMLIEAKRGIHKLMTHIRYKKLYKRKRSRNGQMIMDEEIDIENAKLYSDLSQKLLKIMETEQKLLLK